MGVLKLNEDQKIGVVTHFFSKISVAVIKLTDGDLKVGDKIRVKGATTDFEQDITSMQVNHKDIEEAKIGFELGMKVAEPVRENDEVYKI